MQYRIEKIPLAKIDMEDGKYRITTRSSTDDLVSSMEQVGLLNPPILEERADGYVPVSGFRRISAGRRLNWKMMEARILNKDVSTLQAIIIAVSENSMQRMLDLVETARALKLLTDHVTEPVALIRLASALGLPDNPRHMEKITTILNLPQSVQHAVAENAVSLSIAASLDRIDPNSAVYLCKLFCDLKIGLNKQQEILTRVEEIAAREDISINSVLNCPEFQSIVNHEDFDRTWKQQAIRKYLRKRRYPNITKNEAQFEFNRRHLRLGRHIKLEPPPFFESSIYTLKIQFTSLSELEEQTQTLNELVKNPYMKKILHPLP